MSEHCDYHHHCEHVPFSLCAQLDQAAAPVARLIQRRRPWPLISRALRTASRPWFERDDQGQEVIEGCIAKALQAHIEAQVER